VLRLHVSQEIVPAGKRATSAVASKDAAVEAFVSFYFFGVQSPNMPDEIFVISEASAGAT